MRRSAVRAQGPQLKQPPARAGGRHGILSQHLRAFLPLLILLGLMVALSLLRASAVDDKIGQYIACAGCFDAAVWSNDLIMLGLVSGILLLAGFLRPAPLARVVQLGAGAVILIHAVDLILFHLFHARLFMSDAALFIQERAAVWDQFESGMGGPLAAGALLIAVLLMFLLLFAMPPARERAPRTLLAVLLGVSLTARLLAEQQPYVNGWAVDNVFTANLSTTTTTPYSDAAIEQFGAVEEPVRRHPGATPAAAADGRNVIVLLLESWSSWHSTLFGGFTDWTPQLDAAARRGLRFTNFHAIGFSTAHGLMGIIAGEPLWAPFIHWYQSTPFHSVWGVGRTLPSAFLAHGYTTAFLTTGPLDLYRKGEWLAQSGFQHVEGLEHEFYDGWPAYSFGSAPDRALYQRAEQWRQLATEPYLLVLETVTTHQPYIDPESGQPSLELAMKYADREFGEWLDALDQARFFDDGLLLVVSDHRSMTPISAEEFARFGNDAYSRVPAFVIGKEFDREASRHAAYSQSDIVPTFEWWLSGTADLESNDAVMFPAGGTAAPPGASGKCAFHERGNQRGLVDIICDDGRGLVRLDGDQTRFVDAEGLGEATQREILADIARTRLRALRRHQAQR